MRTGTAMACLLLAACASGNAGTSPDAGSASSPDAAVCGDLPCAAIYVAPGGNDAAAGTREAPLATISAAINKAAASSPSLAVFVQAGTYTEAVSMRAGVSVYGGFDAAWTRAASAVTEIDGPSPAVTFESLAVGAALDHVTVHSTDATAPGASSFGIVITSSSGVELRNVTVTPGAGAPGSPGSDGTRGPDGGNASNGTKGCEDSGGICSGCDRPLGGDGGTSSCAAGGKGGDAGHGDNAGDGGTDGVNNPLSAGAPGPQGGYTTDPKMPGGDGLPGQPGGPGMNGSPGESVGTFQGLLYLPASGGTGAVGGDGTGGGGGGGGGGGNDSCDSYGASGGGGGGAGCGGTPGTGGTGGGGSFGIIALDSAVVLRGSMVVAGVGGMGGAGGIGGGGCTGGAFGTSLVYGGGGEQDDGGMGGAGGKGGDGGQAGHGGGGGGGPSTAIVCLGSATITIPSTMLVGGTGGAGGPSMGNAGATGVSSQAIGCSLF